MNEKIRGIINLLGLIMMVMVMVALIKHIDKLAECVITNPLTNEIIIEGLYGDAESCGQLRNYVQPYYQISNKDESIFIGGGNREDEIKLLEIP